MEETATALERTQDEESRKLLKQTEDRLQEEIKKLQIKSTEMVSFPRDLIYPHMELHFFYFDNGRMVIEN